ncbi:MAG: Alpha-ketoglutarate-dependent taurine dioxygenase [Alphaproteobacteria bacterium MarineAlpha11_Bin1]|mgnify:CR=1 FL=1|nr:MAG: Alpha-ketoglutarate-dependent taurine dioxygenase [Alphaproteobacteria bacterium MarineAlpha11_Bin1]|tara:strand:+ start:20476 stop:21306 length:831 start_codon:yes stop_codon:yes gene_type:complete
MAGLDITTLSPALGAEIRGIDFMQPLDNSTLADIKSAWLEHLVLVFRCGEISEDSQIQFAGCFGSTVGARSKLRADGGDRRLMVISNVRENGKPIGALPDGELMFHSDSVFLERPLMGAMLYAEELPSKGGNTLFASMYSAYQSLSEELKTRIDGLRAVNVFDYETQVKTGPYKRLTARHATHPVVRTHPETGRRALYVNRLMTEEILGLPPVESDELLQILFAHAENRHHVYEHIWRKNDLVLWDNRCTQHARTNFPAHERRLLRRVGIEGDVPI